MTAGQASSTAKVIAASTIALASDARTAVQVAPGASALCRAFLSGSRADRLLARSAAHPVSRWLWRRVEAAVLPGIVEHYWNRKRWIEARCRTAIAGGIERVVILGAGLDTLGWRLAHDFVHIDVIEVDHPDTQHAKRHGLQGAAAAPCNLHLVALDLGRAPIESVVTDDGRPTLVVMEGVLMYLTSTDIAGLFESLRRLRIRQVIFSFMMRWPDGSTGFRPRSWLIERWLAWRGEPFRWALALDDVPAFVNGHGLQLAELATTPHIAPASTKKALDGEVLVLCHGAKKTAVTQTAVSLSRADVTPP